VGELVFHLLGLSRGLVFEAHRLFGRHDLLASKFEDPAGRQWHEPAGRREIG
jgi:hypothetical protein